MKSALISVGTELLMGQTINTNVAYLSQELNTIGIDVKYHVTVGDNPERLKSVILSAYQTCDIVITTGGLGPTQDDLTKEIVAEALGVELEFDEASYINMKKRFEKLNSSITKNNNKQCYLPKGSTIFDNDCGTAPGFGINKDGRIAISLPGPPVEMKAMFERHARKYLAELSGSALYFTDVRTFGIGESQLETLLLPLIDGQTDPTFATYAKGGESLVRITSKAATTELARAKVEAALPQIRELIGQYIYSENGDSLPKVLSDIIVNKKLKMSIADGATAGLLANALLENQAFETCLDACVIKHLPMSETSLIDEVKALFAKTQSDICVAVSGIAGPEGGNEENPVGSACVSLLVNGKPISYRIPHRNAGRILNQKNIMMNICFTILKNVL